MFYYKTDNFFMSVEVVETELSLNVGFGTSQQLISLEDSFNICESEMHSASAVKAVRYSMSFSLTPGNSRKTSNASVKYFLSFKGGPSSHKVIIVLIGALIFP